MATIRPLLTIPRTQLGGEHAIRLKDRRAAPVQGEIAGDAPAVVEREVRTKSKFMVIVKPGMFTMDEYMDAKELCDRMEQSISREVANGTLTGFGALKREREIKLLRQEIRAKRPIIVRRKTTTVTERSLLPGVRNVGKLVQGEDGAWRPE